MQEIKCSKKSQAGPYIEGAVQFLRPNLKYGFDQIEYILDIALLSGRSICFGRFRNEYIRKLFE